MKREEQRARTRRSIRMAFVELLREQKLEQITVTELAARADIDRKTFYIYYNTVNDLIREIEGEIVDGLKVILDARKDSDWKVFLQGLNELMQKDIEFYSVLVRNTDLAFIVADCTGILEEMLYKTILSGREHTSVRDEIIIRYTATGILGVYSDWLKSAKKIPLEELIEVLGDAMNNTLVKCMNS